MNLPKSQAHAQYKYCIDPIMVLMGTVEIITGSGAVSGTDYNFVDEDDATTALTLFLVPSTPIGVTNDLDLILSGLNTDSNNPSDTLTVAALTQLNSAVRVDQVGGTPTTWTDVTGAVPQVTGYGNTNDQVDICGIPSPTNDALWTNLRYMRNHDITPGASRVPIPDRLEPARVTIRIRESNEFSVTGDYVDNDGVSTISKLRGRTCCFMIEQHEDGGPVVTEYQVLGNAAFNEMPISFGDNAVGTITGSGFYRRLIMYQP